jgi:PAS domain S-box-containing protein
MVSADIIHLAKNKYLLTSSTDISINKKAIDELKSSKERFTKAFKASPVALSISTVKDGRMIEVNKTFLELFGFTMEEVIGSTATELNMYPNAEQRQHTIAQLREQGYVRNKELICNTKTNEQIDVIFSMEMIDIHGEPCVITTALNITDKKKAEEKLKNYTDLLEQKVTERTLELTHALEREKEVSDMKSRFVSIASHEFRTPLSTILSSTYLLEQGSGNDFDKSKHFNRIRSSVKNLTFILTEFLSLDKLEQRKVTIENELFDLETLSSEVIDEVRIAYRLPIPLDYQHEGPSLLYQDKRIIRNILLNLISNAAKYSSTDETITIKTYVYPTHLRIIVIDHGIGIPPEDQKNIFTKFFRAHNANHIQGTGLGLSIVKRYVELLEGSIHFHSTVGEGTEFEITLPIRASEEQPLL